MSQLRSGSSSAPSTSHISMKHVNPFADPPEVLAAPMNFATHQKKPRDNISSVTVLNPANNKHPLSEPAEQYASDYAEESTAVGAFLNFFRGGLIAPSQTTYDSIQHLLTAETEEERDELTKQFRDHKNKELNFVGVVGALLTGCLTSTGSWPTILQNGKTSPWTVRVCWFCGIVFGLFAVLTAAQQSIRLHRLSAHRDAMRNIRHYMGCRVRDKEGVLRIKPRRFQVYGWQASILFLTLSVVAMIVGMCVLVWTATEYGPCKLIEHGWWDDNSKLAVTWTAVTLVTVIAFVLAQISLAIEER